MSSPKSHSLSKIPGLSVRCLFMSSGTASSQDYPTSPITCTFSPELGDKAPLLKVPHLLMRGQSDQAGTEQEVSPLMTTRQSDQAGTEEEASPLMTSFHGVCYRLLGEKWRQLFHPGVNPKNHNIIQPDKVCLLKQ